MTDKSTNRKNAAKKSDAQQPSSDKQSTSQKPATQAVARKPATPRRLNAGILWLTLLFALAALAFSGWQWYHLQQLEKRHRSERTQLLAQLDASQQANARLVREVKANHASLMSKTSHLLQQNKSDWLLLNADQQIRLANLNLYFTHNVTGTLKVLQRIDRQLASLPDSDLLPLRKQLAKDISQLRATPNVDLAGVLSQLSALQQQLGQLPLAVINKKQEGKEVELVPTIDKNLPAWRRAWQRSLRILQKIVLIRRHDTPVAPLPSAKQQEYLIQNIYLLLQQAKWAAVSAKPELYQQSLSQAKYWLTQHFTYAEQQTTELVNSIDQLQKVELDPAIPSLSATQKLFSRVIKTKLKQHKRKQTQGSEDA